MASSGASAVPEWTPPSAAEVRTMFKVFRDAKDRWKIDGATMKCFYLHSESGYLYVWNQPTGTLYEYEQSTARCQAVWSSSVPQLNAELWTVLPLPPTDPASLQASVSQSENLPNQDVFLILTVAHESGRQLPPDVLDAAVGDFSQRCSLKAQARRKLCELPPAGQGYVIQNFRPEAAAEAGGDASKSLMNFVAGLQRQTPPPWGNSACTLRVEVTGAIIGRCCPDLDALCREDPLERFGQAHCKVMSEEDRFFICDMETSEEGTTLDGFAVSDRWVGPLQSGSLLTVGPLRIRIQLSDMAKDTPLSSGASPGAALKRGLDGDDSDDGCMFGASSGENSWRRKVFQKTGDEKAAAQRRQLQYQDRAEARRQRCGSEKGAAIDGLIGKFESIRRAEEAAAEAEEARVEEPTREAHREAHMNIDGSFIGFGGLERAGIGFHGTAGGAEFIPNVLNPKALSPQDAARLKTQMRFQEAR